MEVIQIVRTIKSGNLSKHKIEKSFNLRGGNEFNVDTSRETEYNRRSRQVDAWNDIAKTTKFDRINLVLTFCFGFCLELVKK